MTLAGLSIRRPVATSMIVISVIFIGIITMFSMRTELLPNMEIPTVTIRSSWSGAVAEDVETQITKKIEAILPNVEGIDKIESTSSYGSSSIVVKFNFGTNADQKVTEIQREVSKILNDLPKDASNPVAKKIQAGIGSLSMVVMMSAPNKAELTTFVDEYLKPKFESLPGAAQVDVYGNAAKQLQIQVDSEKLAAYNLSPVELYNLISSSNTVLPIGTLQTGTKQLVVRYMGEMQSIEDFENMIISSNGNTLRLKDISNVVLTREDESNKGYISGKEAITILLQKSTDGSTVDLTEKANKALRELKGIMPKGTEYNIIMDTSVDIKSSITGVSSNALQGLILATIVLFVFLRNIRATFLITLALPISVIFTFAFLKATGTTLNLISLMGLSIGVGMLTDNSVVVIDNIYRHITELHSPVLEASENGSTEVSASIFASALTTMLVFIPILFIPGFAREIFRDMAYAIIFSNVAALIVALTLIPMLASKLMSNDVKISSDGKIFHKIREKYLKLISYALSHRKLTIFITLGIFVFSIFVSSFLKFNFMPKQDQGRYSITAELPNGLDLEKSDKIAKQIEAFVKEEPNTKTYFIIVGNNSVNVNVDIGKKATRSTSVFDIIEKMRPLVSKIPDTRVSLKEDFGMGSIRRDVEFQIKGANLNEIKELGTLVQEEVSKNPKLRDVKSSLDPGNQEARIILNRDKIRSYGINPVVIAQNLSYYILGGNRGNTTTIKTGTENIDVLVRLPKEKRQDINQLKNLNIKIGDHKFIKVGDVADIVYGEGSLSIQKKDRIYSVTISANDNGLGVRGVQQAFIEAFKKVNQSDAISYSWGGESENMNATMSQLSSALLIAIFLIYALIAAQFESFLLPFVVIGSIPLALIGVFLGLFILGQAMNMMTMIGIILLAGIVVNNAIVLIDFIQLMRVRGMSRTEAIIEAGSTRLRPILMTTATTVLGMIPMALGFGEGSEIYKGMSLAVIFGLSVSTLLTLIVIPILYSLMDDFIMRGKHFFSNFKFFKKIK